MWKPDLLSLHITAHSLKVTRSPLSRPGRNSKFGSILLGESCRLHPWLGVANKTSRRLRTETSHPTLNALLGPLSWPLLNAPIIWASALPSRGGQKLCLTASFAATKEKPASENDSCRIVWARMGGYQPWQFSLQIRRQTWLMKDRRAG